MKKIIAFFLFLPIFVYSNSTDQLVNDTNTTVQKSKVTRKEIGEQNKKRDPASLKNNLKAFEKLMNDDTNWEDDLKKIIEN